MRLQLLLLPLSASCVLAAQTSQTTVTVPITVPVVAGPAGETGPAGLPGTPGKNGTCSIGTVNGNAKVMVTPDCVFSFDFNSAVVTGTPTTTLPTSATGTTWFVRPDGGNRYDAVLYSPGQCDGKTDAPYTSTTQNHACAFYDVRHMWNVGVQDSSKWLMAGGDTLVIRGCDDHNPNQMNPTPGRCRIGTDTNDGQYGMKNWWNQGTMPPIPSGTTAQHTRILGGCAYDGTCTPVVEGKATYPGNNLTQLFASYTSTLAIALWGSQNVDLAGLEITTHNGKCARYGTTNPLPGCQRGPVYDDQADQGIVTDNTTAGITLTDMWIHGFSSNGIAGPIGGKITATRVAVNFNTFAGWNFDDGKHCADGSACPTANGPHSSIEQHELTMIGNGFQEEYPIVHTAFPAAGGWDNSTGGFGDAWSGQQGALDGFSCDHCFVGYNTKDGAMGPHTLIGNLSLTNSLWVGNMGQSGKWAQGDNSTFLFQNNTMVGNCMRMSQQIPGAAMTFASATLDATGHYVSSNTQPGQGLSGYCRAAGPLFDYFSGANSKITIDSNTIVTYQPTIFEPGCLNAGTCGTSPLNFTNNKVIGLTSSYTISPFNPGQMPGLIYKDDSSVPVANGGGNVITGVKNDAGLCGASGCLATTPAPSVPPESNLDSLGGVQ